MTGTVEKSKKSDRTNDGYVDKNLEGTKKCVIKRGIKFEDYKNFLENGKTILSWQQKFKIEAHNIFTEKINKILLSASNSKYYRPVME